MGLGTLGFRHVLALTGDPAKVATTRCDFGLRPELARLIKLMAGMNRA